MQAVRSAENLTREALSFTFKVGPLDNRSIQAFAI